MHLGHLFQQHFLYFKFLAHILIYILLTRNFCSSIVIAGSIRAHNVSHVQLPSAVHPLPQSTPDSSSLEPSPPSPRVPPCPVVPPSSQTLVPPGRLKESAQLDERTRTSASRPLNVAGAAPSAVTPVASAKSIESSGLQVRFVSFLVMAGSFGCLSSCSPRSFTVFLRCRPKCASSGS